MAMKKIQKLQLQKDSQKSRERFAGDKIDPLQTPAQVWKNPNWTLPTSGELITLEIEYDEDKVVELLNKAGEDLKSIMGKGRDKKAGVIETKLAIALHEHLKELPRKLLFDNDFWFYIFWKSPIYGVHRYDTSPDKKGKRTASQLARIFGVWRRASIPAAYLAYYFANECGICDTDYEKCGSRLRMWILDESPLISKNLRNGFVKAVIGGKDLDDTWKAMFQKMGSLDVDGLTEAEIDTLFATI